MSNTSNNAPLPPPPARRYEMKRTVIALTVTALTVAVAGAGVASAKPGNGAQKSGLAEASGLAPLSCSAADRDEAGKQTANGFVVLNAPGKPAKEGKNARPTGTHKLLGEVVLRNAEPGDYHVRLANGSGCGTELGIMTVNAQGTGTYKFEDRSKGAGTWNIVLTQTPFDESPLYVQRYASAPVTVK